MAYDANDADTKKAIEKSIEEAVEGLKTKNTELLAKVKKATAGATIDPAEHQALQAELEAATGKLKEDDKALKTALAEGERARKALETESGFTTRLLIDNGLSEALLKAGVKPEFNKAAKALLSGQVALKTEGDKRTPVVGEKALGDFITDWAKSDEGKHFVAAPGNAGGGASGGASGGEGQKTMGRAAFEALNSAKRMEFSKGGGTVTD